MRLKKIHFLSIFSEGGNFSNEEIDIHKKKLERMAIIIDKNETLMLKEMEKLEKKQLDEATKILVAFQDKFEILFIFLISTHYYNLAYPLLYKNNPYAKNNLNN